jgi:hypothetical protein
MNGSTMVGNYYNATAQTMSGFIVSNGITLAVNAINPDGALFEWTAAHDMNNSGSIVGGFVDAEGNGHGFLLASGTFTQLDFPSGSYTTASGVNAVTNIVGSFVDSFGITHGYFRSKKTMNPSTVAVVASKNAVAVNPNARALACKYLSELKPMSLMYNCDKR